MNVVDEGFWKQLQIMKRNFCYMIKECQRERMENSKVQDSVIKKQIEEIISDRVGLEKSVTSRTVERLYPDLEDQHVLKVNL